MGVKPHCSNMFEAVLALASWQLIQCNKLLWSPSCLFCVHGGVYWVFVFCAPVRVASTNSLKASTFRFPLYATGSSPPARKYRIVG
jgi:hypothetical protein